MKKLLLIFSLAIGCVACQEKATDDRHNWLMFDSLDKVIEDGRLKEAMSNNRIINDSTFVFTIRWSRLAYYDSIYKMEQSKKRVDGDVGEIYYRNDTGLSDSAFLAKFHIQLHKLIDKRLTKPNRFDTHIHNANSVIIGGNNGNIQIDQK